MLFVILNSTNIQNVIFLTALICTQAAVKTADSTVICDPVSLSLSLSLTHTHVMAFAGATTQRQ